MAAGTSTTAAWRPRVVIVGGGPAGALAANYIARRGCDVKLYERATFNKDNEGRSYVVVLTRRQ
ncbi:NAD(P)/FAD-dependent oxidoreductase, partial [Haematococcus lacustris]